MLNFWGKPKQNDNLVSPDMIDLHCHILPDIDDGPQTWEDSLEMARIAAGDGIRTLVATPHLFRHRIDNLGEVNEKQTILQKVEYLRHLLHQENIALEILAGCDFPLSWEALELFSQDRVMTINDGKRYLLLELPHTSWPLATAEICHAILLQGITPIITHPERHFVIQEKPEKLGRLLDLGCLAQLTAGSLTGMFGRRVEKISRHLLQNGYIHLVASDAHSTQGRVPLLSPAKTLLSRLLGPEEATAMTVTIPQKIIRGEAVA